MIRITTGTRVARLAAVVFVDLATGVATLARVAGVDVDNVYTDSLTLIFQLGLEFVETPSPKPRTQLLAPSAPPYTGEVLQYVGADGFVFAHCLRDAVISVPHEPLFPSGDGLEFPSCRPGAFALELTALKLVFTFSFDYPFTRMRNPRGKSNKVIQTPVHTDDLRSGSRVDNGDTVCEIKCPCPLSMRKGPRLYGVRFDAVLSDKPLWDSNICAYALTYAGHRSEVASKSECASVECEHVRSSAAFVAPAGLGLFRVPRLYSGASRADRLLYVLGQQLRVLLATSRVKLFTATEIGHRAVLDTPRGSRIENIATQGHGTQQPLSLFGGESNLYRHRSLWYGFHLTSIIP